MRCILIKKRGHSVIKKASHNQPIQSRWGGREHHDEGGGGGGRGGVDKQHVQGWQEGFTANQILK